MKIRMYNVGFGDCFCLRDRKKSLLVDFGSSNNRIGGRTRSEVFDVIAGDLTTIEKKNLLLTHFHLDHLSGLLYMMKHRKSSYEFGKIYLPDVFSRPEMNRTLTLFLLADLMKDSYLPSKQVSLFALVEALCKKPQHVELISRGSVFEEKYQALWPDTQVIARETGEICAGFLAEYGEVFQRLEGFAEKLRQVIWSMTEEGRRLAQERPELGKLPAISVLDREFKEIRNLAQMQLLLDHMQREKIELRQFKNKISIVFQNAREGENNLLFTGDVQQKHMKLIAENYDGKLPLYEHYWCIKVPHHGTNAHFFDFRNYAPENMLISNGIYYANSKKQAAAYRTSAQYAGVFYINNTHMYCSGSDCCDGYCDGCTCKESDIIAPSFYKEIG